MENSICSNAPAEALIAPGEILAEFRDGTTIPCAPKISAVLAIALDYGGLALYPKKLLMGLHSFYQLKKSSLQLRIDNYHQDIKLPLEIF